jgi:response regulator RpfG family c-di-GMP phosphodiesterase/serine/threonine protein kinase
MQASVQFHANGSAVDAVHPVTVDFEGMLDELLESNLVLEEDWQGLEVDARREVLTSPDRQAFLDALVGQGLLNHYQATRIDAGSTFGMILGNYRVLDRIGAGGMGVVFRAEHIRLRRQVAIKVLPMDPHQPANLLLRFYSEVRAIAQLVHPNIVAAIDAGELVNPNGTGPTLHYLVMEYVPGQDLEEYVLDRGPLPVTQACDIVQQVASALSEANNHGIVHRDIKPSNVIVTPEGIAKLLDFGLTRSAFNRVTEPGCLLGTIDFMAPEQVQDASAVDIRADLYGLGGTLYWCLTGQLPFPPGKNLSEELCRRLTQAAPSVCALRADVPRELDGVVRRMMAVKRDDRFPTPELFRQALLPWVTTGRHPHVAVPEGLADQTAYAPSQRQLPRTMKVPDRAPQVLVVDDEPAPRDLCCRVLRAASIDCEEAGGGPAALRMIKDRQFDLVLLDIDMPEMSGLEVCRQLRLKPPTPHLKIITMSGLANPDDLANMLLAGADDFLSKPFSVVQLQARVKAALRLKQAQDRSDNLNHHLLALNEELKQNLRASDSTLIDTRNALVLTLARMVEQREGLGNLRLTRLQMYTRIMAEEAAKAPEFTPIINASFIDRLVCAAPLLDIGKMGLPDHILLKPGQLAPDERLIMQTHTVIGTELLQSVARHHGAAQPFLQMAMDVARHHHERWDGTGYPDLLAGEAIPLAARLVAPCDVYDALRSRRLYRPGLAHAAAMQVLLSGWECQLDPKLREPFLRCGDQLAKIFREVGE